MAGAEPRRFEDLEACKQTLLADLRQGSVVLTAPTGTGKSTKVPCWFEGTVLIVEPRRIACQSLAKRVSELDGSPLGGRVGYHVRDDDKRSAATQVLYVTPGIVLQDPRVLEQFETVILDEFHERRLDVDWICAWLLRRKRPFLVMSATIAGTRVADYLSGRHVAVRARAFPVRVDYLAAETDLPEMAVSERLFPRALQAAQQMRGDALCFLPGKFEIQKFTHLAAGSEFEVLPLHGALALQEQARVFETTDRPKLVLATNVAETSITLPGIRTVIDTGLVRRTHYYNGRGYLALASVAEDSADQRCGRAGRTAPGQCLRLWGRAAKLQSVTPPEIHRESLTQLVLWCLVHGVPPEQMPFLDVPNAAALATARAEGIALGALDPRGELTERGRALHRVPVDPWFARVLVEAQARGCLSQMIELVACLSQSPPIALPQKDPHSEYPPCDMSALLDWYHAGKPFQGRRAEVTQTKKRLRRVFSDLASDLSPSTTGASADYDRVLKTLISADHRAVHIPRTRKQRTSWAAGGTELELAKDSFANLNRSPEAIVVLATQASGIGKRRKLLATRASCIPLRWLVEAGLGEERVMGVAVENGQLLAKLERVYAGSVIQRSERAVTGQVARDAAAKLYLSGRLFPEALASTRLRLQRRSLAAALAVSSGFEYLGSLELKAPPTLEQWIADRLEDLGLESGEDLALLSEADLVADDVPAEIHAVLDSEFPLSVELGDCTYRAEYDLEKRQVLLQIVRGRRAKPPPLNFLPKFRGFKIIAEAGGSFHNLGARR